jgi:hypothetical protein
MYGDYEEKIKVREQGDGCEVGGVLEVNEEKICWNGFRINMMRRDFIIQQLIMVLHRARPNKLVHSSIRPINNILCVYLNLSVTLYLLQLTF